MVWSYFYENFLPGTARYCDRGKAEEVPLRDTTVKSVRWTLWGKKTNLSVRARVRVIWLSG